MKKEFIKSFDVNDNYLFSSSYAYIRKNNVFLINQNNGGTILIDKNLYNKIKNFQIKENYFYKFKNNGFIVKKDVIQDKNEKASFFIVELTNKCNLKCKYCFRNPNKLSSITEEIYEKALNYIKDYVEEEKINNFSIQLWGGEPLLEPTKIFYAREFFDKFNLHPSISIETNATLLSSDIVKKLKEKDIHVGVSIDGNCKSHDFNRVYNESKGSYEKVVDSLENLQAQGSNFGSISVVSKKTLNYVGKNINHMCKDLGIYSLKLNLVQTDNLEFSKSDIKKFIDKSIRTLKKLKKEGYPISEANIRGKLQNLVNKMNTSICNSDGCHGGEKLISFSTKGEIFPCDLIDYKKYVFGSIFDNKTLKQILIDNKKNNSFFSKEENTECNKCPFIYYCKGGCKTAKVFKNQDVSEIDYQECMLNRYLYRKLIKLILEDDYKYLL